MEKSTLKEVTVYLDQGTAVDVMNSNTQVNYNRAPRCRADRALAHSCRRSARSVTRASQPHRQRRAASHW